MPARRRQRQVDDVGPGSLQPAGDVAQRLVWGGQDAVAVIMEAGAALGQAADGRQETSQTGADQQFHQHFTTSATPARYLATAVGGIRYPFTMANRRTYLGAKEGER